MAAARLEVQAIFETARTMESRDARETYLQQIGTDHAPIAPRVRALLAAYDASADFLESPAVALARPVAAETAGTVVGPYTLIEQIGEGGMGTVFLAEQTEPVRRTVALKVIKAGMDTRQVVARFEAERQALAVMDHANIARVLDAGATAAGRLYFVMELVRGVPITQYCDEHRLTPRQRLELFVPVCQAIQHAHQNGIIHRDVKPSNVLIALADGQPVPKVIDFGVAKAVETAPGLSTQHGMLVGTLEYMSPEQAEMGSLGVDTRSDIYSLGVLLYELLTGTTPLTHERAAGYGESLRVIREVTPPRPSARLGDAKGKPVRGELDWIAMRCLEKDRSRRYATANDLAMDVQRYLRNEPVQACPPTVRYRLRKFAVRNRGPVLAATAFAVLLVSGVIAVAWQAVRATRAEQRALTQRAEALANFQIAQDAVDRYLAAVSEHPKLTEKDFFALRKELLETAVPFYQKLAEQRSDDPELEAARGRAYNRLAEVRNILGEKDAALADYEAMRAIYAKLASEHPGVPAYRQGLARSHNNRGTVLVALGKLTEAEAAYLESLKLKGQLAEEFPGVAEYRSDLANSHNGLGMLQKHLGRLDDAEESFRTALKIREASALSDPEHRNSLAGTHNNLGILQKAQRKHEEAETSHRAAQQIYGQLAAEFPKVATYRINLAMSHNNLANALSAQKKHAEAETAHRAAIVLQKQLAADFPSVVEYRQDLAMSLGNIGILLRASSRFEEAETAHRSAIAIREQLAAEFPSVAAYALELGNSYKNYGILVQVREGPEASLGWYGKALATLESVLKKEPRLAMARHYLSLTHWARADALDLLQRYPEAVHAWDRALEFDDGTRKQKFETRRSESQRLSERQ